MTAATAVALAHIAAGTVHIRIGAGGIMLPNHAPLLIAEQFGTLAALHPGRVDLGLGRAPGSDQITAQAMRGPCTAAGTTSRETLLSSWVTFRLPDRAKRCRRFLAPDWTYRSGLLAQSPMEPNLRPCSAYPLPSHRISRRQ